MRYLAIDYGLKRTGLAVCDAYETVCSPLIVLDKPKQLVKQICEIIKSEAIEAVVIGQPLNMDGTEGSQAKLVGDFAKNLKEFIEVPIYFQDERLSSFAAEKKLRALDLTRAKKKKRLDAVAAAHLLEAFLQEKSKK